jgi:hypothetical protein
MHGAINGQFAQFQALVTADSELFNELRHTPDPEAFAALAVKLGAERGFAFAAEDVRGALQCARRAWIERNLA